MAALLETEETIVDQSGTQVFEPGGKAESIHVETRENIGDNYVTQEQAPLEAPSKLKGLEGQQPTPGKRYFAEFNTTRNITLTTPKNIVVMGWGVVIEKIYKPSSEILRVNFYFVTP